MQISIQGGCDFTLLGRFAEHGGVPGEMRGQGNRRGHGVGKRFGQGTVAVGGRQTAHGPKNPVPSFQQGLPAGRLQQPGRLLGKGGQKSRFGGREALRAFAQILPAGNAKPHQGAAERGVVQVAAQYLGLGQPHLQAKGQIHLHKLVAQRAAGRPHQPYKLHGDGGAAGNDLSCEQILPHGPAKSQWVHAGVQVEAPVLGGQQGAAHQVRHLAGRQVRPPAYARVL